MRTLLWLTIALICCAAANSVAHPKSASLQQYAAPSAREHADPIRGSSLDEIIYWEDWESGNLSGWTPSDGLWRVAVDSTSPGGFYVVVCNDSATGQYPAGVFTTLTSPLIDVRSISDGMLAANLTFTGHLPDPQTFPDCDWWAIEVSRDSGTTWCNAFNPLCDPLGTDMTFLDCPPRWDSFFEPMDFTLLAGNVLQVRFVFESNLDTVVDTGLRFDNMVMEYWSPFVNDISCYSLQVRYPNAVHRPFRIIAYFRNDGVSAISDIQSWWRVVGDSWRPFFGVLSLQPGETILRDTILTLFTPGDYVIQARSAFGGDQNSANDTATVEPVSVWPEGSDLLVGYDNRTMTRSFNYPPGSGPLVHFTPLQDSVVGPCYRLDRIRARFSAEQTEDREMRWHVYREGGESPGEQVLDTVIVVHLYETGSDSYKEILLPADSDPLWWYEDFWVWLEVTNSAEPEHYPQVLGENAEPWPDIHFFEWTGSGIPAPSAYFYQIQAVIIDGLPVSDGATPLPLAPQLEQNYPNPFNATTTIVYDLPKSGHVSLRVFDLLGCEVAVLNDGFDEAGTHRVTFDGSGLPSGIYFARLDAEKFSQTKKLMLLK